MIDTPEYAFDDVHRARRLVHDQPWALLVSTTSHGPVASHVPVLLEGDPADDGPFTLVTHLGRPDDRLHELTDGDDVLLVVEGPYGYVSPGWYGFTPAVPTWNYVAVHLWARVEMLDATTTLGVLSDTVDRFEDAMPAPVRMDDVADYAHRIARGTCGLRLHVQRWQGKAKLSQDKPDAVRERVVAALRTDPVYARPALADAVQAELDHDRAARPDRTPEETR
ncbi:FMN-binding negative transcriptional regulator [Cellulomonas sp. SLBN-39]|uniref:FMN-binding negative transcriptional regulator n=1 Tax=Cellulomonas sp. SLBN-39 TaxID=2768446 RepID=UPI00114D4FC1|nr:FMN-binding negative transcriptional regulator [Cellulomonas sp. SLBN-39]TQL03013.1 PaiB family negative transcriptional regulator [Cellulomonas sp. SLBN-39]